MKPAVRTSRALRETLPPYGVVVLESHHADDFVMEWRRHSFLKLLYALRGAGELWIDRTRYDFQAGDLLCVPSGRRNRVADRAGEPVSLYVCCIARSVFAFDAGLEERLPAGRISTQPGLTSEVRRLLRRLTYWQRNPTGGPLIAVAGALGLLSRIVDESGAPSTRNSEDPEMRQYVASVDANFFDLGDLDSEAARLGMSRRTFTARFRSATGQSWLEYVRGRAIDHACRLLVETDSSVTAVAFECGFADLSTFYRQFKARTGESPAAWRADHGPPNR